MSIIFLGDLMPGRFIRRNDAVHCDLLQYLQSADLRVCNLEGVVTSSCPDMSAIYHSPVDYICQHGIDTEQAKLLSDIGIDCCSIANNHVLDFKFDGVKDSIQFLNENGIKWFGFGKNWEVAWKPRMCNLKLSSFSNGYAGDNVKVDSRKVKIAFFGLADHFVEWKATNQKAGINYFDVRYFSCAGEGNPNHSTWTNFEIIEEQLNKVRKKTDLIVFSIHWGDNFQDGVLESFRLFAHCLIDAGVNIVHAHSSHHVQAVEAYNEGIIMYGCGEFLNDYDLLEKELNKHDETLGHEYVTYSSHLSFVYKLHLSSSKEIRLSMLEMLPIVVKRGQVACCTHNERETLFAQMKEKCDVFGTKLIEEDKKLFVYIT